MTLAAHKYAGQGYSLAPGHPAVPRLVPGADGCRFNLAGDLSLEEGAAGEFERWLDARPHLATVRVVIDSRGGLITRTEAISVALRIYRGETIAEVAGRAHSGAAEIVLACDRRIIRRGATIMFHRCSGLSPTLAAEADNEIIGHLARLTRNPLSTVRAWVDRGVVFDASQALRYGLVDSVSSTPPVTSIDLTHKPRP